MPVLIVTGLVVLLVRFGAPAAAVTAAVATTPPTCGATGTPVAKNDDFRPGAHGAPDARVLGGTPTHR